ncbi:Sodium/calcium exchanger protein-domain-containing protein [Dipodascopsis tothii]|uniref:Sodium/calcium exchanger protein-domain-containing protein n=1 Tax=Dipodascopsis tothii TaxID=44089 RepID=UPI0034CF2592
MDNPSDQGVGPGQSRRPPLGPSTGSTYSRSRASGTQYRSFSAEDAEGEVERERGSAGSTHRHRAGTVSRKRGRDSHRPSISEVRFKDDGSARGSSLRRRLEYPAGEDENRADGADETGGSGPDDTEGDSGSLTPQTRSAGEDDEDDSSDAVSVESFTLRERQDAINESHPFGIRIWKPALYKKDRSVQRLAEGDIHSTPGKKVSWVVWLGNYVWSIFFGFPLWLLCQISAAVCFFFWWSLSAREYGRSFYGLGNYLLFPFGKFVQLETDAQYALEDEGEGRSMGEYQQWRQADDLEHGRLFFGPTSRKRSASAHTHHTHRPRLSLDAISETDSLLGHGADDAASLAPSAISDGSSQAYFIKRRLFGRGEWNLGRVIFYLCFYLIVYPILLVAASVSWFLVFSIPMARVTFHLCSHLRRHPLALSYHHDGPYSRTATPANSSVLLCTYRAFGWNYYKYTVDGTNVFLMNLMFVVVFTIFDQYLITHILGEHTLITRPGVIFVLSLCSVIPLAYFIGMAVASISAQSSMGMGAAINAFFSTIVEVFLYCVALTEGKGRLVEGSVIGSILAGVLLMPGLSMCSGALKRKTQRYNPKSAGVSSTMLLFAIIGAFAPTLFYQVYGSYELTCMPCSDSDRRSFSPQSVDCRRCNFYLGPLLNDEFYNKSVKPFSYLCSLLLFAAYCIGSWFTLRTHAAMIWQSSASAAAPTGPAGADEPAYAPAQHALGLDSAAGSLASTATGAFKIPMINQTLPASAALLRNDAPPQRQDVPLIEFPASEELSRQTSPQHKAPMTDADANVDKKGSKKKSGTVKSHVSVAETAPPAEPEPEAAGGHDAPNWSRKKSVVVLLGATILYAVIAEILVDTVDVVLDSVKIDEKFLGITLFALVPNTTEFLNAISFAMNGNIALSMEIGSAYVLQVCLLQIPALVVFSIFNYKDYEILRDFTFSLVFPRWDLVVVVLCVFLLSYIYAEGRSNYFKGSILILSYMVAMGGFWFSSAAEAAQIAGNVSPQGAFFMPASVLAA